jgi:geranylgeranyl pyrophosphate synthase
MTLLAATVLNDLPQPLAALRDDLERLEAHLQDGSGVALPALETLLGWVFASGGKRIRPALVFATARLGQADPAAVLHLAAAIETLHAASLVHDDLVDGSLVRRGLPTLNARWSASATVLAGDWLFARAARFAADTESVPVLKIFARTLGALTEGELRQLIGRTGIPDRSEYEFRIYAKTASLFEAATESAAELMAVSRAKVEALSSFGRELGTAFQIADDILDFVGDGARLGKPIGNDLRSGQVTLPAMLHLEADPAAAPWLTGERDPETGEVDRLVTAVRDDRRAIAEARAVAIARRDRALEALSGFPPGPARDDLERIAVYAVERNL